MTNLSSCVTVDVCLHHQIVQKPLDERTLFSDKLNIFVLSEDPQECAQMMCDRHVQKMSIEYAQLLINAHVLCGEMKSFEAVLPEHPSSLWVSDSVDNYLWLQELTLQTWAEHKYRYGRESKYDSYLRSFIKLRPNRIPSFSTVPTPPPQCLPVEYRCPQTIANPNRWRNAISAYRTYYIQEKYRIAKWTQRAIPAWFSLGMDELKFDMLCARLDEPGPVRSRAPLFKTIEDE